MYKAIDTRLGRTVALKILHAGGIARMEREARTIAALNHPHICTLYDIGPNYLVMEYVDGAPLSGPLPVREAVSRGLEIAGALEAAHARAWFTGTSNRRTFWSPDQGSSFSTSGSRSRRGF